MRRQTNPFARSPNANIFEKNATKLELVCPHCNSKNPSRFSFCGECGNNLDNPSDPVSRTHSLQQDFEIIQRYLPEEITQKILSQKSGIQGERKQVTIMFCDMSEFTQITEKFGPDQTFYLIDELFDILVSKVNEYQGVVNELRGDGILAFFGAPTALEDAPQRAIRSALAIQREMTNFSDKIRLDKDIQPLQLRIGINTGPVVVGSVGNNLRTQYTAMGDTINIASRIESMADSGTIYVSEETFRLTEGFFRFEALGEREVKGKKEPVNVFRVLTPNNRRTRFDVSAERGLTSFLGREKELELLVDGFQRTKRGAGQAFFIESDPGLGKSRLLYEFRKKMVNEEVVFLEGKCLSYSNSVPYHLIIDILKSAFNIHGQESDREKIRKIENSLGLLLKSQKPNLPYLFELLSIKNEDAETIKISPEAIKDKILETLRQFVLKGSEHQPVILAFEDLHWMDKSSEAAINYILESIEGTRVLLIFTYRPEYKPTWRDKSYHNRIQLNRLSDSENLTMVRHILNKKKIDNKLEKLILEKTEGVPFYIEEFIQSLTALNIIEIKDNTYHLTKEICTLSIPSTIHDVIMSRVDSLPFEAKELLQLGSAIEREFSYALIKEVAKISERKLLWNLSLLKKAGLLYERGRVPRSSYIFKHALTREVVYDSILTRRRMLFHDEIGKAIEMLSKNNIDQYYAVLSRHFMLSENFVKGAEFSRLAGKEAQKRSSYSDAISFGKKCIVCLEKLPQSEAGEKSNIVARIAAANYCMGINHHYDAQQFVAPIMSMVEKKIDEKQLAQINLVTGSYKVFVEEDFASGIEDLLKAKILAEETEDLRTYWYAVFFLGSIYYLEADFEKSVNNFKKSLAQSNAAHSISGICFSTSSMTAWPYGHSGKLETAYQKSREALALANESGDIFIMQAAYSSFGCCCFLRGLFKEAEKHLKEANALYDKAGNLFWGALGQLWAGELYFMRGDFDKAQYNYKQSKNTTEHKNVLPSWSILNQTKLLQCKASLNSKDIHLDSLFNSARENKIKVNEGVIAHSIADILMTLDNQYLSESERWLSKAIEANNQYGSNWRLADDYALYARLNIKKNNRLKAKEQLVKAIALYKKIGADGWVEKYNAELASFS